MQLTIIIERDEDDMFVASALELKGCHTQAKTLDELRRRMNEAVKLFVNDASVTFDTTVIISARCHWCH